MAQEGIRSKFNTPARVMGAGLVLWLLVATVYVVFFHSDLQAALDGAKRHATELAQAHAQALQAEHAYQKDLAELTARQQREGELAKVLPQTTESAAFLSGLQNVANIVGVNLQGWTPLPEVPQSFYAKVPMRLRISGRYHQIAKFFYSVGQLERIINMENISMLDPEVDGDDIIITVDVLATAFHLLNTPPADDAKPRGKKGSAQ